MESEILELLLLEYDCNLGQLVASSVFIQHCETAIVL